MSHKKVEFLGKVNGHQTVIFTTKKSLNPRISNYRNQSSGEKITSSAQKYKTLHGGLSLEGTCITKSCPNFLQTVTTPLGYGNFNIFIESDRATCPICEGQMKDYFNPQFYRCQYKIDGKKKDQDKEIIIRQRHTNLSTFSTLSKDYKYKFEWEWLDIDVQRL